MSISRCTQNPTFMEEWRKGWHPETMNAKGMSQSVLVVGAGPAGLEAALACAQRGYHVTLAEASTELGGRVAYERKLPGLANWGQVADYRKYQLEKNANAHIYPDNHLTIDDVLSFDAQHVCIATGSHWRNDGVARQHVVPIPIASQMKVLTPDDLMAGNIPAGDIVLYDDDHYYMGGVLAELLVQHGANVHLLTPAAYVSEWTLNTLEQAAIHQKLAKLGVRIELNRGILEIQADHVIR